MPTDLGGFFIPSGGISAPCQNFPGCDGNTTWVEVRRRPWQCTKSRGPPKVDPIWWRLGSGMAAPNAPAPLPCNLFTAPLQIIAQIKEQVLPDEDMCYWWAPWVLPVIDVPGRRLCMGRALTFVRRAAAAAAADTSKAAHSAKVESRARKLLYMLMQR